MSTAVDERVVCSHCEKDYTHDTTSIGGVVMSDGKLICPACVPLVLKEYQADEQLWAVAAVCPIGWGFANWVTWRRSPQNAGSSSIKNP
jgi:hypothetical protein